MKPKQKRLLDCQATPTAIAKSVSCLFLHWTTRASTKAQSFQPCVRRVAFSFRGGSLERQCGKLVHTFKQAETVPEFLWLPACLVQFQHEVWILRPSKRVNTAQSQTRRFPLTLPVRIIWQGAIYVAKPKVVNFEFLVTLCRLLHPTLFIVCSQSLDSNWIVTISNIFGGFELPFSQHCPWNLLHYIAYAMLHPRPRWKQ